jgi:3-isopropylmalate/(R)-2-methylmalate dehydratase small subunit
MERFTTLTGTAAAMFQPNIDTDALLPSRYLTQSTETGKSGFGPRLFADWRYEKDGAPKPDFALNKPEFANAVILITGDNFGCGSSRENAVWALVGFGIRCVIAPGFGEIFFNNCFENGLLPIVLDAEIVEGLATQLEMGAHGRTVTVDLRGRTITAPDGTQIAFTVDDARRAALLDGLDAVGITLQRESEITDFQTRDKEARPWIYL